MHTRKLDLHLPPSPRRSKKLTQDISTLTIQPNSKSTLFTTITTTPPPFQSPCRAKPTNPPASRRAPILAPRPSKTPAASTSPSKTSTPALTSPSSTSAASAISRSPSRRATRSGARSVDTGCYTSRGRRGECRVGEISVEEERHC